MQLTLATNVVRPVLEDAHRLIRLQVGDVPYGEGDGGSPSAPMGGSLPVAWGINAWKARAQW